MKVIYNLSERWHLEKILQKSVEIVKKNRNFTVKMQKWQVCTENSYHLHSGIDDIKYISNNENERNKNNNWWQSITMFKQHLVRVQTLYIRIVILGFQK